MCAVQKPSEDAQTQVDAAAAQEQGAGEEDARGEDPHPGWAPWVRYS